MSSDLEDDYRNIRFTLGRLLEQLRAPPRIETEAALMQKLCTQYRRLAICSVLLEADIEPFFSCLSKSAQAYLSILQRIDWSIVIDRYYLCTSRALPFFDAIAADDFDTARSMVPVCASTWAREDEYEDDFLYVKFLMDVLRVGVKSEQAIATFSRFQAISGAQAPARFRLCEALLAGDERKFEMAWAGLLLERSQELARERANPGADPEMLRTEAHVFIEGVALLRLAASLGMRIQNLYPQSIPEWLLARPQRPRPEPLAWRTPP
ncbi:hypothetical protein ACN28I_09065 [Archangium gephyra]|uniref:hypothetical protein n=1 Tax=Archangium gephyra TaxID=48 RepID=UPI003B810B5B